MNSNTLGIAGLLLVVVAVGALAGPWWAVLTAGAVLLALAYVAHRWETQAPPAPPTIDEALDAMAKAERAA